MQVTIAGSGGWGTALAILLHENGHDVTLWSHFEAESKQLAETHQNPYLPGVTLPEGLHYSADPACAQGREMVVFATPSFAVRTTARAFAPYLAETPLLVSVTKGIEEGTGYRMSELVSQETGRTVVALSGPSHAEEVSRGIPTGVVVACPERELAERVQNAFMCSRFRVYTSPDTAGIELGGYPGELVNVTPQSLKAEYDRILSTAYIDVMVQGVDEARVADMLLKKLDGIRRDPHPFAAPIAMPATPLRHFKEEIPGLTQAKLCMLFTTGEANPNPPSVSILRVAMSVLGGSATSRLFRNVREKQSLCYYCGSAAQRATGVMMIDSGVEPGKEQQAEAAIIAELEGLKNGPITQEEVDDCRRGLLSSMDALGDSLAALENWYYGQITRGEPLYPPEYGKVLTSAVSLDEVRQTLQSYSYSVCYAVTAEPGTQGKGGSEDVE